MPKPIALAERNFDELFDRDGIIVVNFWSKAYPPSMNFNTIFEAASKRHEDVIFATLDVETETVLADEFGVEFVPSVFVMRDGEPVIYDDEPFTPEELEELIADVRTVDMDDVRAENESFSKTKAKPKARPAAKKVAAKGQSKAKVSKSPVSAKAKKPAPKAKKPAAKAKKPAPKAKKPAPKAKKRR